MQNRVFGTAVVGLVGAIVGSFSMMLYASTHFANVAGSGGTPPVVSAAPLNETSADGTQNRIVNAIKRVEPSVVALNVVVNGVVYRPADPFSQFFGGGGGPVVPQRVQQRASGSGFVYDKSGLIITNAHVVPKGVTKVEAVFANGDHVPAHVFASNPTADLALVKVDNYAKLPPPVEFADSSKLQSGQFAVAIGEPFELKQSAALGIVSGFNRDEPIQGENGQTRLFRGLLQTSAPINPGNSGGPLIDLEGRVIGVNQSTANPQAGAQGIGFAIPANVARQQIAALAQSPGKTLNAAGTGTGVAYLGVVTQPVDAGVRSQLGYKGQNGAAVAQVQDGTPAAQAGLEPGDVITKIDGTTVSQPEDLTKYIKTLKPGAQARVTFWSGGSTKAVTVTLGEQPADLFLQQQEQQNR